jgi:hypothetical protein
LPIYA